MNPKILRKEENTAKCLELIEAAAKNDCQLLIFPECSLTGYCFSSLDEGLNVAEPIPGPSTNEVLSLCKELGVYTVLGLLEVDQNRCYNALAFLGPNGIVGKYRKIHLPYLGMDRFVTSGDQPYKVYTTDLGKIGLSICFDVRFPESARVMALMGAELIALPTNWPQKAEAVPKYVINARAYENRVNYVAVNRVGVERGFRFIGRSKIVDYTGKTLKEASAVKEETICAQLDLEGSREKHVVIVPGEFELPLFEARRPEFYRLISR
jgi:predicted amidohydrolase